MNEDPLGPRRDDRRKPPPVGNRRNLANITTGEALAVAMRRSRLPIILALLAGTVGMIVGRQIQGAEYKASARVLITTDVSSAVSDLQQAFRDPVRALATERQIAGSHEFFAAVAKQAAAGSTSAQALEDAVTVTEEPGTDVLTFTAVADREATAVATANAVVRVFPAYRTELRSREIDQAIAGLRSATDTATATERQQIIARLELLRRISGGATVLDRAVDAQKTRPTPLRDGLLGFALGLVVASLLVGARELLRTRARSATEVESLLGAPVLGLMPPTTFRGVLPVDGASRESFEPLFRSLATAITRAAGAGRDPVIGVTSAGDDDTAALITASLAVTIARAGGTATIVDVMPDQPVAEMLGALGSEGGSPGVRAWNITVDGVSSRVSELLSMGEALGAKGGLTLIESGTTQGLAPVLSGHASSGPWARPGWKIAMLPPALSNGAAIAISRHLDGIVVVVRQDSILRRNLRALGDQSEGWSCPLLGAILSDAVSEMAIVPETRASSR